MKAVTCIPRTADSQSLRDVPEPQLGDVPNGRGVMVKVLRVGLDGTDTEIKSGLYGAPPPGSDFLIEGHEGIGIVEQVGDNVTEVRVGEYVACIVRRQGESIYDQIGRPDFTIDDDYHEHGINLVHGFLTERYVESVERLVRIPQGIRDIAVLTEPTSVVEKGITQAFEIQRRLGVWQPRKAAVIGAGTIGLLATMALRVRGLDVTVVSLERPPYLNAELAEAIGARYLSTQETPLATAAQQHGPFDLMFECTGYAPMVFDAMDVLGRNGVLIMSSVSGGDHKVEVAADKINLGFVLGNKVAVGTVNASKADFEQAVSDLAMANVEWPGWVERLLTHPVQGIENFKDAFDLLGQKGVIKTFIEI